MKNFYRPTQPDLDMSDDESGSVNRPPIDVPSEPRRFTPFTCDQRRG